MKYLERYYKQIRFRKNIYNFIKKVDIMLMGSLKSNVTESLYISKDGFKEKKHRRREEKNNEYVSIDFINNNIEEKDENFTLYALDILRPKIISRLPKIINVTKGQKVTLICLTTVLFPVEVEWYLNNTLIKPCTDGKICFRNKKRELCFTSINEDFSGVIKCIAKNTFGEDTCKGKIVITEQKEEENV